MKKSKVFKVYLIYFISMAIFCLIRIASSLGAFNFVNAKWVDIIYTFIIQVGLMFVLPLSLYTLLINNKVGFVGTFRAARMHNKISLKVVLISLGIGILAFFINILVSTLFSGLLSFLGYSEPITNSTINTSGGGTLPAWLEFLIQIVLVAVLPAICEEFLHRGLLLHGTKQIGVKKAMLISSLLFGLIHFNINQFFYAFVLGMLMSLVVLASKSIYPSMIIHFTNNAISVYLTYAELNGWFGKNFYNYLNNFLQSSNAVLTFVACFTFLSLIVVLLITFIVRLFKLQISNKVRRAINSVDVGDETVNSKAPIYAGQKAILEDMLENNTTLNLNYEEMKSPIEIVLPKDKNVYKTSLLDNMFLISSLVLGGLITVFTFVWGVL